MSRYNEDLNYLITDVDISKTELEEIITEADQIISDTDSERDKLIEAYLKKVQCLQRLERYAESKIFIEKLLDLDSNMPEVFVRLGIIYNENEEYHKAIEEYDKIIEANPDYVYAYISRGFTKSNLSDYQGAIEDYNKAIEIDPNYIITYFRRGYTKSDLFDYHGSIEDYNKVIEHKPNYALAYNNRGAAKDSLFDYQGAIEDYNKAIELNPSFAMAYSNRGVAKEGLSDYQGAIEDYNKAIEIDPNYTLAHNNRNDIYEKDIFFNETTEKCSNKNEKEKYRDIYIKSLEIISKLQVKYEIEMPVSHYTKKEVAERLLFDDYFRKDEKRSSFRLNSVNTSNDPKEGKILFHFLFPKKEISLQIEEFGAFAGCFIFNNDSLNQFRLYGKADNEEGTGVSITLNEQFFNKKMSAPLDMKSDAENKKEDSSNFLPLFRCIYINPETDKVVSLGHKEECVFYRENKSEEEYKKYKQSIDDLREEVCEELNTLKEDAKDLNQDIVHKLLLNLRYLIKHAAFKEEQECRVIQIKKLNDKDKVHLDENNRLYVVYQKLNETNVSEICFAPKAKDIDKFKQHLARNNYSIKCDKSNAPLA